MFFSRHTLSRTASGLFALLIAVILLPFAFATPASATPADSIHSLVNQARWDSGQRGLIRNSAMDKVALDWAKQMAANNSMSHNPNYSSQIPTGWNSAGENVAHGYRTAQAMHDGWMSSPGHKANILGAFTDIGIAFYESGGTTWGVQVFAAYSGHSGPAAPVAAAPAPEPETEPSQASSPSASAQPTPAASSSASDDASSTPSASPGGAGGKHSESQQAPTQAELQASVYGDQPDLTWIAWVVFFGIALVGAAGWFVFIRRTR
ncbi:hypothetical protein A20C1_01131 [marine actinobacterium PHSC20C1]|nr:hypothetical protein A20C1_01131 [marine actinobacterium PHSC20C1]